MACSGSSSNDRDQVNYIRCSTWRPKSQPEEDKKGKKKKEQVCCSTAFRMRKEQEANQDDSEDLCAPAKKGKKGKKGKKSKNEFFRCFTANMICQKLDMPGREFESPEKLSIKADICKGCKPVLCANRINVNHLPQELSGQFSMLAECLDRALEEGISLAVIYNKKEIGRGCYKLPDSVIYRITNTLDEVVHTGTVELTCKDCTVGMCKVRLAMQMRCQILDSEDDDDDNGCGNTFGCDSQSDETSSTDPCQGFYPDDDDQLKGNCGYSSDASNDNQQCVYESPRLIDMAGPYNVYGCDRNEGCLEIRSPLGPGQQFSSAKRPSLGEGNVNRLCPQISAPKLKQMGIKRERECPVCHEDVSWLPKIAACPHCGYKQVPTFEEKDYDERATAKDILVDFFDQIADESKPSSNCDQTCENHQADTKTSEGFESIVQDYKKLKQSIKKSEKPFSCPNQSKTSKIKKGDNQANLYNVFTELKNMFCAGDDDEHKKAKIQEICDEACKMAKSSKHHKHGKSAGPSAVPKKRKRRSKRRSRPVKSRLYSPVDRIEHRPQGHATCRDNEHMVPAHMGWLWTQCPLAQLPGWRPGAIRRSIRVLMGYFLKDYPVDSIPLSKYMSYHKQKKPKQDDDLEKPEDLVQVPTLHIEKKNDEYLITLRPLKDPESLKRAANPYANMKPVQFRIIKNPVLKKMRDMKRCLKNMGYSKCSCHRPVMKCYCRSFLDKRLLVDEVRRQCAKREMANCEQQLVLSDTTDSEAEFDFGVTPPAGLMKPERLKTSHVKHTETQYNENDWAMPTMFPHPPNAQVQYGGCVVGERQDRFDWIFGKGFVHREPKPPKMRNKPKPKPKRPFPGAPMPARKEGGYTADFDSMPDKVQPRRDELASGDRYQRLNRAAHPPTAEQFKQSKEAAKRRVRFDTKPSERFIV